MTVKLDIQLKRGGFHLDAQLSAPAGVTVIFGPSAVEKQPCCALLRAWSL